MKKHNPFSLLDAPGMPREAKMRVQEALERKKTSALAFRKMRFAGLAVASLSILIVSAVSAFNSLVSSGAYQYVALLFTDGASVLAYSKELVFSLLESFPAVALAAVFISAGTSLWSLSRLGERQRRQAFAN